MLALAAAIAFTYMTQPWPLKLGGGISHGITSDNYVLESAQWSATS